MTLNICFLTFNIQKAKPLTSTNLFFFIAWGCVGWVISALFQSTFYLGHRSTFNLSTCCTARWDEGQNLERRKSVANVNWLFARAWKHHYAFAWQLFDFFFFFSVRFLYSLCQTLSQIICFTNIWSWLSLFSLHTKSSKKLQETILRSAVLLNRRLIYSSCTDKHCNNTSILIICKEAKTKI